MPLTATNPSVDWDLAFLLFSQGRTYPEISAATGAKEPAIRSRASRHEWRNKVTIARHKVQQVTQNKVESLIERGELWQNKAAGDLERTIDTLEKLPVPKSLKGLRQHEEVWGMHVKRGRQTFGLDQAGVAVQINIGRVGPASVQPIQDQPEVIDIPSDNSTLDSESSV